MKELTLHEMRAQIKAERPYVDVRPFSHNIISTLLRAIAARHGTDEANKAVRDFELTALGWSEQ